MNAYTEGTLYNTVYETYGTAYVIPKKTIIGAYTVLSVLIPVVVPVFLIPVLMKTIPTRWRR